MRTWITLVATCVVATSITAMAHDSADPHLGTWTLDLGKSKFDPSTAAPKSATQTFEVTPDGMNRLTIQFTAANGTSGTSIMTFKRDGKPYAITNQPNNETNEVTGVNSREDRVTLLRAGKVIGHLTSVISKDGKVMTETRTFTAPSGQSVHDVAVYDKQ